MAFSSDGKHFASAGFDQKVIVWDVASGQILKILAGTNMMVAAIFFVRRSRRVYEFIRAR